MRNTDHLGFNISGVRHKSDIPREPVSVKKAISVSWEEAKTFGDESSMAHWCHMDLTTRVLQ